MFRCDTLKRACSASIELQGKDSAIYKKCLLRWRESRADLKEVNALIDVELEEVEISSILALL